jgi:hypothetical protein
MPNESHIIIPISEHIRQQGFWDEYDKQQQVVRRPSHQDRQMKGRVWEIENQAVWDGKQHKSLIPLQVACLALQKARSRGIDVIRVNTPVDLTQPGAKVAGSVDFSVAWLTKTMADEPAFFPDVLDGKISMEDRAVNTMPRHWQFSPDGSLFVPTT